MSYPTWESKAISPCPIIPHPCQKSLPALLQPLYLLFVSLTLLLSSTFQCELCAQDVLLCVVWQAPREPPLEPRNAECPAALTG